MAGGAAGKPPVGSANALSGARPAEHDAHGGRAPGVRTIALLGNPNSGKTTLFNALTGLRQHVGNFPGVTVDSAAGTLRGDRGITVIDLPGTYSLAAASKDERVAGDALLHRRPDVIINIVDATCLERGLYLTLQLLELGIATVIALNMIDEMRAGGGSVDCAALSDALGVPALPIVAARDEGIDALVTAARSARPPLPGARPIPKGPDEQRILARYAFIEKLCARAVHAGRGSVAQRRSEQIDALLTHRLLAFPIFIAVMALVFYLTFGPIGGRLSDGFRQWMGLATRAIDNGLRNAHVAEWLRGLIVDGVLSGVGLVLSFLPSILTLFFLLSLLEDSGYMARMAFVTDRFLRKLGLSGRSFVPALLGFGCSVPAILATRTLQLRRDRRMTILLVPFLSCSAKLPIYVMFTQAFFPGRELLVMCSLYIGALLLGVLVMVLLKRVAFPGESAPFLLELPAYRMPTIRSTLALVRTRAAAFLRCAMTTLLLASIAVWALQRVDWSFQPVVDSGRSALASIGRSLAPLFAPLGFADWRAVTALLAGLMAKEGVLASLSVLLKAPTDAALAVSLRAMLSPLQAVSFMTFTLLYMPCVAAFAAAKRELGGLRYAIGAAAFQTGIAWLAAFAVYQIGRLVGFA